MNFAVAGRRGMERGQYWTYLIVYVVAVLGLAVGSVIALGRNEYILALAAFLLIGAGSLLFRGVMIRRCREIGWPDVLPWLTLTFTAMAMASTFLSLAIAPEPSLSSLGWTSLLVVIDVVLMITIGLREGAADLARARRQEEDELEATRAAFARLKPGSIQAPRDNEDAAVRVDDAIARALADHRGEKPAEEGTPNVARQATQRRPAHGPRAATFGRRVG